MSLTDALNQAHGLLHKHEEWRGRLTRFSLSYQASQVEPFLDQECGAEIRSFIEVYDGLQSLVGEVEAQERQRRWEE